MAIPIYQTKKMIVRGEDIPVRDLPQRSFWFIRILRYAFRPRLWKWEAARCWSVPCRIHDDSRVSFGKKGVAQILELIGA